MLRSGSGNMGDVTDEASVSRWRSASRSRVTGVRVFFKTGSGSATLTVKVDSHRGSTYNRTIDSFASLGNGTDLLFDTSNAANSSAWIVEEGDVVVLEWTDPGTSTWLAEVTLGPA